MAKREALAAKTGTKPSAGTKPGARPAGDLSPLAVLCDFDGTICPVDVGAQLFSRFAGDVSRRAVARWRQGEIDTRECLRLECAGVRADRDELLAAVGGAAVDPSFARLVALSRSVPFPLVVVSEGLDFYIHHILRRHGWGELPVRANSAEFDAAGMHPRFPVGDRGCGSCGNCKGAHVREFREQGRRVIFVGDGLSDRCGAREADLLFARDGDDLARWCQEENIPCLRFRSLGEVCELLESRSWEALQAEASR